MEPDKMYASVSGSLQDYVFEIHSRLCVYPYFFFKLLLGHGLLYRCEVLGLAIHLSMDIFYFFASF